VDTAAWARVSTLDVRLWATLLAIRYWSAFKWIADICWAHGPDRI
jgi:hypothetical protein